MQEGTCQTPRARVGISGTGRGPGVHLLLRKLGVHASLIRQLNPKQILQNSSRRVGSNKKTRYTSERLRLQRQTNSQKMPKTRQHLGGREHHCIHQIPKYEIPFSHMTWIKRRGFGGRDLNLGRSAFLSNCCVIHSYGPCLEGDDLQQGFKGSWQTWQTYYPIWDEAVVPHHPFMDDGTQHMTRPAWGWLSWSNSSP